MRLRGLLAVMGARGENLYDLLFAIWELSDLVQLISNRHKGEIIMQKERFEELRWAEFHKFHGWHTEVTFISEVEREEYLQVVREEDEKVSAWERRYL